MRTFSKRVRFNERLIPAAECSVESVAPGGVQRYEATQTIYDPKAQ